MAISHSSDAAADAVVRAAATRAARSIPPLWPLSTSVAVNPFLGQAGEPLAMAAARLGRAAGTPVTMPRSWFASRIRAGEIRDEDLTAALAATQPGAQPATLAELKAAVTRDRPMPSALPTVADLAAVAAGVDWPDLIVQCIGHWAGGYFDEGQALWAAPRTGGAYAAWRGVASHDLTPEIAGLSGFAGFVSRLPATADHAIAEAVRQLGLPDAALDIYFHRLLMSLGGWAQLARMRLWEAELAGAPMRPSPTCWRSASPLRRPCSPSTRRPSRPGGGRRRRPMPHPSSRAGTTSSTPSSRRPPSGRRSAASRPCWRHCRRRPAGAARPSR